MDTQNNSQTAAELLDKLCTLFLRMIALFFVVFAIQYWLRIVGFYEGELFRFDTMPNHWKAAVAILAVLYPVTALGLWGLFSWGIVLWVAALIVEGVMYLGYPHLFGSADMLVIFHVSGILVYLAFRLARVILAKRAEKLAAG